MEFYFTLGYLGWHFNTRSEVMVLLGPVLLCLSHHGSAWGFLAQGPLGPYLVMLLGTYVVLVTESTWVTC